MRDIKIAVDGIVLREEEVVLVYRKNYPKGWALPGGFVRSDETLEEACRREVREETGLEVNILAVKGPSPEFGVYDDPERDPRKRVVSVVYLCRAVGGELEAGSDARNVKTFSLEKALEADLQFDHNKILEDFIEFFSS
ncbi:MAG: NUDIX domain-containing protein [Candidatus Aenigmatarchaeota archaeon]